MYLRERIYFYRVTIKSTTKFAMFNRFSIILLHLLCLSLLNAEPLVTFSQGTLNGTIQESRSGRKIAAYLGIPYGQPAIGDLRFKNPVAMGNWSGIRQATAFGNVCPQLSSEKVIGNEDCLFLNVYTPLLEFNSSLTNLLPVMVWIHGGSFMDGSSNTYRGNYLLDKDIILVTLNYRLGILGFLSTNDSAISGNFGLKDQVLALKWVQENIKAFGGNRNQVTLFGQSAGGVSVGLHALSNASNGLFHQYIIQSGSPLCDWAYTKRSNVIEYAKKVAQILSCDFDNTECFVNCLKTKSVDSLLNTKIIFGELANFAQMWWRPTAEPEADDAFLTDSPRNLIRQNKMKDLPFMTGEVTDEGLVNTAILHASSALYSFVEYNLDQIIPYMVDELLGSKNQTMFTKALKKFYFSNSIDFSDKDKIIENLTKYISDASFLYSEMEMLEKIAPTFKSPIYFYSFGYRGTTSIYSAIENNRNLGVAHGDEVLYLFPFSSTSFGLPELNFTSTEKSVSELMVDLWTTFVKNGKPTSKHWTSDDFWKRYNSQNNTHLQIGNIYNNTDSSVSLSSTYFTERMNLWEKILI